MDSLTEDSHRIPPLKFYPILKEKVWGGTQLSSLFGKEGSGALGESWELSGVQGNISTVSEGALKGQSLNQLIDNYGAQLLGRSVYTKYGATFPLLFKFLDASDDLSVQLHPDDEQALERHDSFGKTEMWYIMHAAEDARLILGFNRPMDKETYVAFLNANNLPEILHYETVEAGDSFFIAPGTVHAIGAGTVLAEIQQTSDVTYRIYDWDRPDVNGQMRELHTELALDVIDFSPTKAKLSYSGETNAPVLLKSVSYFETNRWELSKAVSRDLTAIDSFVVYMCVDGALQLNTAHGTVQLNKGETALVAANIDSVTFETNSATILEVYVPQT